MPKVVGLDSSEKMLLKAQDLSTDITWILDDLNTWMPSRKADFLFSNATLHWLDNHSNLLPRFMEFLNSGGLLAIQMPNNFSAPTHKFIEEVILEGEWREILEPHIRKWPILNTDEYYEILNPLASYVDLWETKYTHVLEGENPVVEWLKGSALRPYLDKLNDHQKDNFLEEFTKKIQIEYPKMINGKTIMTYRRIFIIARKM